MAPSPLPQRLISDGQEREGTLEFRAFGQSRPSNNISSGEKMDTFELPSIMRIRECRKFSSRIDHLSHEIR